MMRNASLMLNEPLIVHAGDQTPASITQALPGGDARIAEALCEPGISLADEYDHVHCYSAQRRYLRLLTAPEAHLVEAEAGTTLERVEAPRKPAWVPRWTAQVFRDSDASHRLCYWLAILVGIALAVAGVLAAGHALETWQAGGEF